MNEFLAGSSFFGVLFTLLAYYAGVLLKKKLNHPLCNPILIAILLVIAFLVVFDVDYDTYNAGAKYLSYFLTPATVCLAIPLYEQIRLLKDNWKAIAAGIISGVLTSMLVVFAFSLLFGFDHAQYVTFLPKSITTAIGMGVCEELGGYVSITVAVIILTGVVGNVLGETVFGIFRITDPVAKGIGLGTSAHAIGTARALELGEVEGAMSSLSIVTAGLITVILAPLFAGLM